MTLQSGLVAILDPSGKTVETTRDLGSEPIEVKPGRVKPLEGATSPPKHDSRIETASLSYKIEPNRVLRVWTVTPRAPEAVQAAYGAAIQDHIDAAAQARGYADGFALASYVTSTISAWSAEATAFITWRDSVWVHAHSELAKVQGGGAMPSIEDFVGSLPAITWP